MTTTIENENAELRYRLSSLESTLRNLHRTIGPEEQREMARIKERADGVAARLGGDLRVSAPLQGEDALSYHRRTLRPFLQFSERFRGTDLATVDHMALPLVEDAVYRDAEAAAKARADSTSGRLVARVERDAAGRPITKFDGDIMAWLAPFVADGARCRIQRGES